jgi:ferredoxin
MAPSSDRVAILACDGRDGGQWAATTTLAHLRRVAPEAVVRPVRDLCTGSRALSTALRQHAADFVVMLPCRSHHGQLDVDALRGRANDWLTTGTQVVIDPADLLAAGAEQAAKLAAVAAASAAITGPLFASAVNVAAPRARSLNRRAVLTGRLRAEHHAPQLKSERCSASPLCHICVDSCSASALVMNGGLPTTDTSKCDGCGACVLACPADMLQIATLPREIWERFLRHVLVAARELSLPVGLWWACADADDSPTPDTGTAWLRLRVPCVRALTPAWVLQPLSHGAAEVTVTSCDAARDSWTPDAPVPRLLRDLPVGVRATPTPAALTLREPAGTVESLGDFPAATAFISADPAPLGVLSCDEDSCTACGVCVERCPARALAVSESTTRWTLLFSHASCVACGACVARCPEHALTLRRGIKPTDLKAERELTTTSLRRCVGCGTRLPAPALVARLAEAGVKLPDDGRCADCRASGRAAS